MSVVQVWCGVVWCGVGWRGVAWCGVVWCGVVWCGVVWCGVVWCGVVWCGVAWRGVAWRGVAWRGVAWRGVTLVNDAEDILTCLDITFDIIPIMDFTDLEVLGIHPNDIKVLLKHIKILKTTITKQAEDKLKQNKKKK